MNINPPVRGSVFFCWGLILLMSLGSGGFCAVANAQERHQETVVVSAAAYPVPFEALARTVHVVTREELQNLPARSIADVLSLSASVQVRSRGILGIQSDFSIRGSSYSQVLILIDGMRMNDAQTAHHNSDLPVPLAEIERVEVLYGPGSALYGANAFGGIVNIITRKAGRGFHASISAGQFGTLEGDFRAGYQHGSIGQTFTAFGNHSTGFISDRDFRTAGFNSRTDFGTGSSLRVAFVDKEFGAQGFYGPAPSREWTNQTLVAYDHQFVAGARWQASMQTIYRTHGDQFLYNRQQPGIFRSSHRTHAFGLTAKAQKIINESMTVSFGGESGGDWMGSNTLGNHSYAHGSLFTELKLSIGKTAAFYPGLRYDYYSNFGSSGSPSFNGSWWILQRLRIRGSVGRAFRIPTFTELYYQDPNNQASPALLPESSWGDEIGLDFFPGQNWLAAATLFERREHDVIDWIRHSSAEKWMSINIRQLDMRGAEFSLQRSFDSHQALLQFHYTYLAGNPGPITFQSKYALDYARHSVTASTVLPLTSLTTYSQDFNYKRQADGRSYWLYNARLQHTFGVFRIGLEGTNLLNARYQEIIGVEMPGRWITARLEWLGIP